MTITQEKVSEQETDLFEFRWNIHPSRKPKEAGVIGPRQALTPYWEQTINQVLRKFHQEDDGGSTVD